MIDQSKIPDGLAEFMFASEYGWTLQTIRRLPPIDFKQHLGILVIKYRMEAINRSASL